VCRYFLMHWNLLLIFGFYDPWHTLFCLTSFSGNESSFTRSENEGNDVLLVLAFSCILDVGNVSTNQFRK
jgi:hypothetical protein